MQANCKPSLVCNATFWNFALPFLAFERLFCACTHDAFQLNAPVTNALPEATTVLALTWSDGVLMAGDRRATAGNVIAHRRVRKVYPSDEYSAVAISGTAGMAVELIKLFHRGERDPQTALGLGVLGLLDEVKFPVLVAEPK